MFGRIWIFALALAVAPAWAQTLPADYESWPAERKAGFLWNERVMPTVYPALPAITLVPPTLTDIFLRVSFDRVADEMPEGRRKFIHGFGSVGLVDFEPAGDRRWTGLLRSGARGLARFSVGSPPTPERFVPGLALKLFVDGRPSVNLHLMHTLDGIKVWNFFQNEMTNILPPAEDLRLQQLSAAFAKVKPDPGSLPVTELALHAADGQPQVDPSAPAQIWCVPTAAVHARPDAKTMEDFRVKLARLAPGTVLYHVYGSHKEDGPRLLVGKLTLRSPVVSSQWADEKLFFKHQR